MDEVEVRSRQVQVDGNLSDAEGRRHAQGVSGVSEEETGRTESCPRRLGQEVKGPSDSAELGDGLLNGAELLNQGNGGVLLEIQLPGLFEDIGGVEFWHHHDAVFIGRDQV